MQFNRLWYVTQDIGGWDVGGFAVSAELEDR